jgi:serine protease Do
LKTGDIILDINGQKVDDSRTLQLKIGAMSPGTTANLTIFRNGATLPIAVKLGEMPADTVTNGGAESVPGSSPRGISASELTPAIASQLKLPASAKGVVVNGVDPASAASEAGLQQGDVIQQVNRQPITSVSGFEQAMHSAGEQPVLLLIDRNGMTSYVVVQPH